LQIDCILLASEGRAIPAKTLDFVTRLAQPRDADVYVISIARIHGSAYGFPAPGLLPTKREWQDQTDQVANAVKVLKKRGFDVQAEVVGTRKAAKRICQQAELFSCDVIVMAADPPRNPIVSDFLWQAEPYRVRRRAKVPVYLIVGD
jgi:nucleotide-binding universal stress UspA family protein